MPQRNWTRDELLLAMNLYCRTPFGRMHKTNPDILALAKSLGRTPSSVAMKLCNLASLDPGERARGIGRKCFAREGGKHEAKEASGVSDVCRTETPSDHSAVVQFWRSVEAILWKCNDG